MTELLRKVICIRALADDLSFLRTVTNRMTRILDSRFNIFELSNQASHADAILRLRKESYDLAVFFAHGGSDYIRGGEYQIRATGEIIETEKFLTRGDLGIFEGKVVFCMSCNSNDLAQSAIDCGALAFVGFSKIPFNQFDENDNPIGSHVLVKHSQDILAEAVKASLERFVTGRGTLDESVNFLRFFLIRRAIEYVRNNKSVKERREVAALLLQTKNGLLYHGQKGIRFEP